MSATATAPRRLLRYQSLVFTLTWLSYAGFYLTRKHYSAIKKRLVDQQGLTEGGLAAIETVYLLAYAVGQVINGGLGDRFGPRRVIAIGMVGSALCTVFFGLSAALPGFLFFYGVNGYFQATGWPNNVKAMVPWFPYAIRGRVMGIWCTNYAVGGMVAMILAGFVLVWWGWRMTCFVPAAIVAVIGVLVWCFLFETPEQAGLDPVDPPAPHPLVDNPEPASSRSRFVGVFSNPVLWCLSVAYFGMKLIRYSLIFWLPYYLSTELGFAEDTAAYISTALELGGIIGAILTGWLADRFFSQRRVAVTVPMLLGLAVVMSFYRSLAVDNPWVHIGLLGAVGILLFGPDALISGAAAQDAGGNDSAGSAAGMINGIGSLGAVLEGVVTVGIREAYGWDAVFMVFTYTPLVSALILLPLCFIRTKPR